MTAAQEWSEEYNRLHAVPGKRGPVRLSRQGARILQMLAPYPWEGGHEDIDIRGETVSWQPDMDDFVVGHAHEARLTGFPEGDAKRILAAFRHHGGGQARMSGPRVHGERFAPGYTKHVARYEQATRPPRYVVYLDGNPTGRWDDRDEATTAAERSVAGRPDHNAAVKDSHTGRWIAWHSTRGRERRRGFSLARHSTRARYRGH